MDRTLVICKPDAVARGLVGEIVSRFERRGLRIAAMELRLLTEDVLSRHYAEHVRKPFYPETSSVQSTCTNPQAKPFMRDSIFNEYPKRYHPAWVRKCDQFKEKKP